jgi:hypothetical protein
MKISRKSMLLAIFSVIFLIVVPLVTPMLLPSELLNAFSRMGGIDLNGLLNNIALVGVITTILILLNSLFDKSTTIGLVLSIASNVLWLFITVFSLSLGNLETLGLATLSSQSESALNMVTFDLRLFVVLATVIVILRIIHSIFEFQEARTVKGQEVEEENTIESKD